MKSTMHSVSSIVISKTEMETFGTVEVELTTTRGEKLKLVCFHNYEDRSIYQDMIDLSSYCENDAPITLETGE